MEVETFQVFAASGALLPKSASVVLVDASLGSVVLDLPAASGANRSIYWVKLTSSGANTVTLDPAAAELIDGAATLVLSSQFTAVRIICDGVEWHILGTRASLAPATAIWPPQHQTISTTSTLVAGSARVVLADASSGSIVITLPAVASSDEETFWIKRIDAAGGSTVTVDGNAAETIDKDLTQVLRDKKRPSITIYCDGTEWWII